MSDRSSTLQAALRERVLVLDGGMGTAIQACDLTAHDFGGAAFEGCNEHLAITRPDVVREIHVGHLEAGADIIGTDTFGSTALVLAEYGLEDRAYEITRRAAEPARETADGYTARTPGRPRFVAGAMGPTTKAISVTGGITFEALAENFHDQAEGLIDGGADYLLVETCQDSRNIKAALIGIHKLFSELGRELPVAVSATIEPMGTMLAGQGAQALAASLEHVDLLYLGLNCATGPAFMTDHIRTLAELVDGRAPRRLPSYDRSFVSGIESLEIEESNRPVIVGERTNVIGSRKFKRLIVEEQFEEASGIARRQVKSGAQVIDVCLANPDRDEPADMERFLRKAVQKVKVPLMIDSTDDQVIERALTYCQGKSIINSINLEDGEDRFEKVVPMARRFGAAFMVGTIDEKGMAVTRARKLEVAGRSCELLVNRYGVPPTDIFFDPLVFPCATGDEQYIGSAAETIEAIRLIKEAMPRVKTILGVSNVSFGLPPAGREVMNSVFLYHCTQAGLDPAIVNSEQLERYARIPDEEKRLATDVLFKGSDETIAVFAAHFREESSRVKRELSTLTLDERLANYIVEGSKDGLIEDLDRKLQEVSDPLEIINGPLMAGMDEVGRLFNDNELIVAEVLQSAEAMKAAVAHLEPLMEKRDASSKGRVILATVKGDVHDIGKNLVEIILSNNGSAIRRAPIWRCRGRSLTCCAPRRSRWGSPTST